MPASSDLLLNLRRADPDRFFCTLFAPAEKRESLALLYLFNHELARAREVASEPLLARIRLQWWREVVEGEGKLHEIATPLGAALAGGVFAAEDLLALIAAREAEAEEKIADLAAFLAYARGTAGRLARIAGKILGVDSDAVEDLGTAYGIAGILRAAPFLQARGRSLLPADETPQAALEAYARGLLRATPPRAALAAALPAVYARRDLGRAYAARGIGDRLAVLRSAIMGRV
ncbi:MAG: phytoene synthase [Acidocella sp. 20-63-7]|nr:MAG: phytoene synthase [Acidocella sp. 20-63-7]HQT46371.1 squalene/phytoene synthase family protein [Acidocella sp.]